MTPPNTSAEKRTKQSATEKGRSRAAKTVGKKGGVGDSKARSGTGALANQVRNTSVRKKAKNQIKSVSKKAAGTQRSKPAQRIATKKPSRSLEALMAQYKDARPSDVSDKVFVASSPVHGKGLFAAKRLKAGTVISRLHGMPTFDDGIYVLWITDELGLELTNDLKFINHDKAPNAAYSDVDVTIVRDVEAGEELLHDYGW